MLDNHATSIVGGPSDTPKRETRGSSTGKKVELNLVSFFKQEPIITKGRNDIRGSDHQLLFKLKC